MAPRQVIAEVLALTDVAKREAIEPGSALRWWTELSDEERFRFDWHAMGVGVLSFDDDWLDRLALLTMRAEAGES